MAAPISGKQAPGFFRVKVGDYEVTVLSDGGLTLDLPLFAGDEAGGENLLKDAHLPKMGIPTPVNTWLVNTGKKLILVDTGGGKNFAPTLGRMPENLAASGVSPDQVDAVVLTHPHPDHAPGLLNADGKRCSRTPCFMSTARITRSGPRKKSVTRRRKNSMASSTWPRAR